MKATIDYVSEKYDEYNRLIFGGQLPQIPIRLSDSKSYLGQLTFRSRQTADGTTEKYNFCLRVSTRVDLPENELQDIIIHEMIHYFIAYKKWQDTSTHGKIFRKMMNDINSRFGRNINVRYKVRKEQREEFVDPRARWHAVALVSFKNGRTGVKVLPRITQRITAYYNAGIASPSVSKIELFLSKNPFFNRFPNSAVFKVHIVDEDAMRQELKDALPMTYDGEKLSY